MRLIERLAAIIATEKAPPRPAFIAPRPAATRARGFADPRQRAGTRRVVVTLDEPSFARVDGFARAAGISFAAATRILIARGFADEPAAARAEHSERGLPC